MPFVPPARFHWQLRSRVLPLGRKTLLMGILNVTPDSFSDGNDFFTPQAAHDQGLRLLDEGADLLDIGGESTRPNATPVDTDEEQQRVLPIIGSILKARPRTIISVDTYHASTARAAVEAGAEIVNDVSGLLWDPAMAEVIAQTKAGAVLMHTRGAPRLWSTLPPIPHEDVLPLVVSGLAHSLHLAEQAGIARERLVLDPGFGFGKLGDENFTLLAHLADLRQFALPVLAGVSRKRFLTAHLTATPALSADFELQDARVYATAAANTAAILGGAHILRVHDVPAARAAVAVADALLRSTREEELNPKKPSPSGVPRPKR